MRQTISCLRIYAEIHLKFQSTPFVGLYVFIANPMALNILVFIASFKVVFICLNLVYNFRRDMV